jgi:PAS domain S-box-containing protein
MVPPEQAFLSVKSAQALRKRAEEYAGEKTVQSLENHKNVSPEEALSLLHELRVHQIELEMQNEELRRTQEELEASRTRYIDLYDHAPVGYCTLGEKEVILKANLTAATLLGVPRDELVKKPMTLFIFLADQHIYYQHCKNLFKTGARQVSELRMVKKDKTTFWARLESTMAKHSGGASPAGEVRELPTSRVVIIDITGRKQAEAERLKLEQQMQQTQKLESLGILAGGIAHDFNNLMGGIFGYIDLANEESDNRKVTMYLSKAMNTIDRARGLTAQLLTFAKGGAPVQKITPLFPFVQETANFALCGSNVSCCFDIAENLLSCNIDKNQISQIIDNIVINAQQAMPGGGAITISAKNIVLEIHEHFTLAPGDYVKISISDSGIGIPKEIVPRIFDPFYSTKTKGHGLGLTTCYSIINRHGGAIDVESEQGKGSTFHIYLPASKKSGIVNAPSVVRHTGSGTIIVMDDEEVMRDSIRKMLEKLGYSVECKNNGKEVVEFFLNVTKNKHDISGLILDLTVPGGMGGKEAIAEIRKLNAKIPVFVTSGYADDPIIKNPAEYGFTASICKPFRKFELAEMFEKHLNPGHKARKTPSSPPKASKKMPRG